MHKPLSVEEREPTSMDFLCKPLDGESLQVERMEAMSLGERKAFFFSLPPLLHIHMRKRYVHS